MYIILSNPVGPLLKADRVHLQKGAKSLQNDALFSRPLADSLTDELMLVITHVRSLKWF